MNKLLPILVLFALAFTQLACNLQNIIAARASQQGDIRVVTVIPAEPEAGNPSIPMGPTAYPTSPEEVVREFLVASQEEPQVMVIYLSPLQQQSLPAEGAQSLLKIDAPVEGFAIESATVSPDPPASIVTVALQAGGDEVRRTFNLIQHNGSWFIDSIHSGG